jgi:serine/threonine-protein kinase RsbW
MPVAEQRNTGKGKKNDAPSSGTATGHRHLLMPGNPNALPQIREIVVEAAERSGFDPEEVAKIEMAVGEACSNIIEHAYRTQPLRPEIEIDIQEFPNRLEITILDYSTINFPVDEAPNLNIDDYIATQSRRGLGLYIIRNFVDKVEHRFVCGQGNQLRLVKYFV